MTLPIEGDLASCNPANGARPTNKQEDTEVMPVDSDAQDESNLKGGFGEGHREPPGNAQSSEGRP